MARRTLWVREDDTIVCRWCYDDEGGDHVARPAHRELHAAVRSGECESCGFNIPHEGGTINMTRQQRVALDDQDFEAARARATEPNHNHVVQAANADKIRMATVPFDGCKETNS